MRVACFFMPVAALAFVAKPIVQEREARSSLEPRELPIITLITPKVLPLTKVTTLTPVYRSNALRKKFHWGPLALPAQNETQKSHLTMDPNGWEWSKVLEGVPQDMTIIAAQGQLVYDDGSPAGINTGVYNHHTTVFDRGQESLGGGGQYCLGDTKSRYSTTTPGGGELIGWGQESNVVGKWMFTTQDGKLNSGWYRGPKNINLVEGELVNYDNVTKNLYVDMDVEYVEGKPEDLMPAYIQLVNIEGCLRNGVEFTPTGGDMSGAFNKTGGKLPIAHDGYILQQKGHVHDGGDGMTVAINGETVCNSTASYGGPDSTMRDSSGKATWETISAMSDCFQLIPVRKGDEVELTAYYNPSSHPLRQSMGGMADGEMGMMTWYYALKPDNVSWVNTTAFASTAPKIS